MVFGWHHTGAFDLKGVLCFWQDQSGASNCLWRKIATTKVFLDARSSIDRRSIIGYCLFVRGILCLGGARNKMWYHGLVLSQNTVMADLTCDLSWVKELLLKFDFTLESPLRMYCNNQVVIHITENSVFHEHTKHIETVIWCARRWQRIKSYRFNMCHQLIS